MKPIIRNFIGIVVLMLLSCNILSNQGNQSTLEPTATFYTEAFYSSGDYRLPLIEPYQVGNFDHKQWIASTSVDKKLGGLGPVSQIDIRDSVIFIYCLGDVSLYLEPVPEAWFVIQPDKKIEIGFASEAEFKAYLKEQGIGEPEWKDIQTVWETFRDTGELPWKTK